MSGILFFNQLTIYGQSAGTGQLEVEAGGRFSVAIQGDGGKLTVNGGIVTAKGDQTGIYNSDSNLTINDGTVTATGGYGIVNLGSQNLDYGKMTINGGTVTAIGTENGILNSGLYGGTTINSGTVIASGKSGFSNGNGGSMTLPTTAYWWRTAAGGVYTASTDTSYSLGGEPYIEITTTAPVVTPPADEPEPEPTPEPEPVQPARPSGNKPTTPTETVSAPKTADPGVLLTSALSVVSLLGMGYVGKKR